MVSMTKSAAPSSQRSPLQIFLLSACITAAYIFFLYQAGDSVWIHVGKRERTTLEMFTWWMIQLILFSLSQGLTTLYVQHMRKIKRGNKPFSTGEQKAQDYMLPYYKFNMLCTIPVCFAINLSLQHYLGSRREHELWAPAYILMIECVHHTCHSAVHVQGWFGWKLHQVHHIKDHSLPISACGNHPIDFVFTIVGVVAGAQIVANREPILTTIEYMVIGHIGTLVHSDCHWLWFLDFHGMHHSDGRYDLNAYIPFTDLLLGTFKMPSKYPRKAGWR